MKKILFFSRSGLFYFFSDLKGDFESFHVVINKKEKEEIESKGEVVVGCFEEEYNSLPVDDDRSIKLCAGFAQDRFFGPFTLKLRQEIKGKLTSFWKRVLSEKPYDAVVHEIISCEFEETLSLVCKQFHTVDLTPVPNIVVNTFFFSEDPYNSSFSTKKLASITPSKSSLERAEKEVIGVLEKGRFSPEVNWQFTPKKLSSWGLLKLVKDVLFKHRKRAFTIDASFEKRVFYYNNYHQSYDSRFDELIDSCYEVYSDYDKIDYDKEIIFFPLQYEPEATLNYFSPVFDDQVFVIQTICKFLKDNQVLVVKEHPGQPFSLLKKKFQLLGRRNSNLYLVGADLKLEKIKDKVSKVITISSTVGWEALVFEKPTFVFGNVFYDRHPDAYKFTNFDDLVHFLTEVDQFHSDINTTIIYLAKILECSHNGSCLWFETSDNNKQLFSNAIDNELSKRHSIYAEPNVFASTEYKAINQ